MSKQPTRRALLGAAITIPAAAVMGGAAAFATAKASETTAVSRAAWERALADFQQADAAMNAYLHDLRPLSHAYQAVREKWPIAYDFAKDPEAKAELERAHAAYDPAERRFDEFVDEQCDACEVLMRVPAPDGAALVAKLDILMAHQVYEWSERAELMAAIQQDARRLLDGRA